MLCHRSEAIKNSKNPNYPPMKFRGAEICNSNLDAPIKFKVMNKPSYDYSDDIEKATNNDVEICSCQISLFELTSLNKKAVDMKNKDGQVVSQLEFKGLIIENIPNFVSYLKSGWEISLAVAIDFTTSNGIATDPKSLHYLSDGSDGNSDGNQYQQVIGAVGSILEKYNYEKSFPVYGFGGTPTFMGETKISHCFPLNGDDQNPEVVGTQNIL